MVLLRILGIDTSEWRPLENPSDLVDALPASIKWHREQGGKRANNVLADDKRRLARHVLHMSGVANHCLSEPLVVLHI